MADPTDPEPTAESAKPTHPQEAAMHAMAGMTELYLKQFRAAVAGAAAVQAELIARAAQAQHDVAKRLSEFDAKALREQAQEIPTRAAAQALSVAGKAEARYEEMSKRGRDLMERFRPGHAADAVPEAIQHRAEATVAFGRDAAATARKVAEEAAASAASALSAVAPIARKAPVVRKATAPVAPPAPAATPVPVAAPTEPASATAAAPTTAAPAGKPAKTTVRKAATSAKPRARKAVASAEAVAPNSTTALEAAPPKSGTPAEAAPPKSTKPLKPATRKTATRKTATKAARAASPATDTGTGTADAPAAPKRPGKKAVAPGGGSADQEPAVSG